MSHVLFLKIHRWTSLVFALPLLVVILTGLILSFEPIVQAQRAGTGAIDAERLVALVQKADPAGKARGIALDAAAQRLRLQGPTPLEIDLAGGEATAATSPLADLFLWARRTHEHLLGQSWLVIGSTVAMVVVIMLGTLMGLPRLRNTLSGWHKGVAWIGLPLILASPLTGLCLAFGLTFQGAAPPPAGQPLPIPEAIRLVAQSHDLSEVVSIGARGGRMMARIVEDGELRAYAVSRDGVVALPRNWPRLIHEGNWSALLSGSLNVITSVALLGLLGTGVTLWGRRTLRRRARDRSPEPGDRATAGTAS